MHALAREVREVMLNMFFIDIGYPCSVQKSPGFAMHYSIVKLLRTAAYQIDMSPIINTTSDFVENMVVEPCRKKNTAQHL